MDLDRLSALRQALDFDQDLSVEAVPSPTGGDDEHIYVRHTANPEFQQRIWDHEKPEEVAASLRVRQLETAPTLEELQEESRKKRLQRREHETERARQFEEARWRELERRRRERTGLAVVLVRRMKAVVGRVHHRGSPPERRPAARRRPSRLVASRDGPPQSADDPPPPDRLVRPSEQEWAA